MTDLIEILNDKANIISDEAIFDKDENNSYFNDQLNLKDTSRFNGKDDLIVYTPDFNLFADYNQTVNDIDMSCDINDDDLYYTKPKNMRLISLINNEQNEIGINKSNTSTSNENDVKEQKKNKIFVKLGRKKKGEIFDKEKVHSKESKDNISIKFKRLFLKNLIKFLNNKLEKSRNLKLNLLRFKFLNSGYIKSLKKDLNLEMLDSPAFAVLSQDIAKKYKNFDKDYNKKIIKLIYEENEKSLMIILNQSIRKLMKIFCNNKKEEGLFKEYKRLDEYIENFIKNLSENEKDKKDYFNQLKYAGINFEEGLKSIFGRNRKNASI
jgi:hypothetical protein